MVATSMLAALLVEKVLPPSDVGTNLQMALRLIHFAAGITWIGLLYFLNLVNVPLMKVLDAPTKGKVVPQLMPRVLWWFRWSAAVTVLAGFVYWYLILRTEPPGNEGAYHGKLIGLWLVLVVAVWAAWYGSLRLPAVTKSGYVVGVVMLLVAAAIWYVVLNYLSYENISNRAVSIGIGGGYGLFMLLNVWGVIWPIQKRIITWTKENAEKGTPIPAESAALARRAFLVSRANFYLSFLMLFLMGAASHYPMFGG